MQVTDSEFDRKFIMDPAQTSNQNRIGVEGRGGSTVPGMIQRSSFRNLYIGGLVAAGNLINIPIFPRMSQNTNYVCGVLFPIIIGWFVSSISVLLKQTHCLQNILEYH